MMTSTPSLRDALAHAELIHDRAALDAAIVRMAAEIDAVYGADRPLFLTVMHGGMFFAAQLALAMRIDADFDYLHATRYRGSTEGATLHWLHHPASALAGRRVLLVDDILDEGPTLAAIRQWCREQGAAEVRIAVLAWKRHDRLVPDLLPDHVGVETPDRYVFGYGMDFHEQGRNLPAIYALKD